MALGREKVPTPDIEHSLEDCITEICACARREARDDI